MDEIKLRRTALGGWRGIRDTARLRMRLSTHRNLNESGLALAEIPDLFKMQHEENLVPIKGKAYTPKEGFSMW